MANNKQNIYRNFGPTSLAVNNGTSVFLLTIMVLLFGFTSYNSMPKEQFPEIVIPTIYVGTAYAGNSAEDMENLVTKYIEKEVASINGVKELTSTSIQDFSTVIVEFNTDIPTEKALREVKDAVDKAESDLPNDLTNGPNVFDINLSEVPILTVNLSGAYKQEELREYAERLQDDIEKLSEINEVQLKGVSDREVRVDVDLPKMQSLQVSFTDIERAIGQENLTMSAGELKTNSFRRSVRVIGEFKTVDELRNIIVKSERQNPIYLRDIATVKETFEETSSIARANSLPVVSLDVIKRSGENLLEASDKIKEIVKLAEQRYLPSDMEVTLFNDQSVNTRNQVANLENSIISGVILVVLVLLFFLGFRNALFVGLAIPLSMLLGILILNILGITLNIVVLFSLILALGLLVDNAIVVVENIYRYMQEGYSSVDAAKKGAGEVATPIIASTATTLAAFVPLMFWPGIFGEFMQYLPLTLIIVLASSLFVALVINPVFTNNFMRVQGEDSKAQAQNRLRTNIIINVAILGIGAMAFAANARSLFNLSWMVVAFNLINILLLRRAADFFQNKVLVFLENVYDATIRVALRTWVSIGVLAGTVALLFGSFMLLVINSPKVEFFPSGPPTYVNVFIELPIGTSINATDRLMRELEQKVQRAIEPYDKAGVVDAVLTQIGEDTGDPSAPPEQGSTPHKARITVAFVPEEDRNGISTYNIMEDIRESVQGYPGVDLVVDRDQSGPPAGKPINLEIIGSDAEMEELLSVALEAKSFLEAKSIAGVEELKADVSGDLQEELVEVNRDAARRYGVSTYDIAMTLRTALYGKEVSKFKDGEDEYPIMLRSAEEYRESETALMSQRITFRNPSTGQIVQVPISAVASKRPSTTFSAVKRSDERRVVTIFSNVLEGYNANEIVEEMKGLMAGYELPEGFDYQFTGEQEEQKEAVSFLSNAFLVAIFAIFLILVAQFNSISSPVIVLISVLFSTIGVLLGYVITGQDFVVVMTGIGIVSLAGIVVNNAIVLIDYIDFLRSRSEDQGAHRLDWDTVHEAIILGGKTRLRPVLLTAFTTILGLIPLAIGFNIDFGTFLSDLDPNIFIGGTNAAFWGPMAWTVIYGLTFATFLTLIVVPVMYWLVFLIKRGIASARGRV